MGCVACTEEKIPNQSKRTIVAPTHHYRVNTITQQGVIQYMDIEKRQKIFREVMRPYQIRYVSFSEDPAARKSSSVIDNIMNLGSSDNQNLAAELKEISGKLPFELGKSMFLFVDDNAKDHIKAVIAGPEHTPFANSLFVFDMELKEYPEKAPKIVMYQINNFNFQIGQGIKEGGEIPSETISKWITNGISEKWSNGFTLAQCLLAIQDNMFNASILETDEELFDKIKNSEKKAKIVKGYNNIMKYIGVRFGMLELLQQCPSFMKEFLTSYLILKKDLILIDCERWVADTKFDDASYDSIVQEHNPQLVMKLGNGSFCREFNNLIGKLEVEMEELKIHIDPKIIADCKSEEELLDKTIFYFSNEKDGVIKIRSSPKGEIHRTILEGKGQ